MVNNSALLAAVVLGAHPLHVTGDRRTPGNW